MSPNLKQPKWNSALPAVCPQRKLKLPSRAQIALRSVWFKGGMLIQSRSIKLRKALCLGPKNNFPTLSPLSVLGGEGVSGWGVCVYIPLHLLSINVCLWFSLRYRKIEYRVLLTLLPRIQRFSKISVQNSSDTLSSSAICLAVSVCVLIISGMEFDGHIFYICIFIQIIDLK